MYKNVKLHNRKVKEKAQLFLDAKGINSQKVIELVKDFRKNIKIIKNQPSNKSALPQNNNQKITNLQKKEQADDSDEQSILAAIAHYQERSEKIQPQNINKRENKKINTQIQTNNFQHVHQRKSGQSKRISTDIRQSFQKYSFQHSKNKSSICPQQIKTKKQHTDIFENYIEKKVEMKAYMQQSKIVNQRKKIEQISLQPQRTTRIIERQTINTSGKFTLHDLKQLNRPLTKNYRIGNKQQWQNKKQIKDYQLHFILRKFPKVKNFKNNQKAIIKCSLMKNDVFVCMPTGGGKSLTFQAMTFIQKGVYLCILPLVSLIMDQEYHAKNFGIKAYSFTGAKQAKQNKKAYSQIQNYQPGDQSIVIFCTPQKIGKSPQFNSFLDEAYSRGYLVKIVIDQVHCVSTWGKQFRQDYQNLSILRARFPQTPILGLTATVTQYIKQDIITRLGIQNCYYFQSSFNRPNLYYQVRQKKKNCLNQIVGILQQHRNQSGIIYCLSRKQCQQMCKQLQSRKYKVGYYHANITQNQKRNIQNSWMQNQIQIIIATIAFGMGINKPDVRFVIHHSLSKSLQNYYQQSGRAGRDGDPAKCILYYKKSDKISLQNLIMKNQLSDKNSKTFCMKQLSNMIRYCEDKYTCRRKFQLNYLGQLDFNVKQCSQTCDNCRRSLSYYQKDVINEAKLLVQFMIGVQKMKQDVSQNQMILLCKGSTDKKLKYKVQKLQSKLEINKVREAFKYWNKQQIDELITQLCSFDIFNEKIVTMKLYRKNSVSNVYLKVNFINANRFLKKVQILPMKRYKTSNNQKYKESSIEQIPDDDFDFDETNNLNQVSDSEEIPIGYNKKLTQEDQEFLQQIFQN